MHLWTTSSTASPNRTAAIDRARCASSWRESSRTARFATAPQLTRLLTQLVESALSGAAREVKEYTLGVELFGRGASFDPKLDNIVRSHAHRLRQRLDDYFDGPGRADPIVIEIPKGHYVASFRRRPRSYRRPTPCPIGRIDDAWLSMRVSWYSSEWLLPLRC